MTRQLALDNTVLNALQKEQIDLEAASKFDCEYYVPVTQRHEFVQSFDQIGFNKQHSICEVLVRLDPEPVEIVSSPYGVAPYGRGPYGGGDMPHYEKILQAMGDDTEHAWDALGAETAIVNDMEFVSNDECVIDALGSYSPEHLLQQRKFKTLVESAPK